MCVHMQNPFEPGRLISSHRSRRGIFGLVFSNMTLFVFSDLAVSQSIGKSGSVLPLGTSFCQGGADHIRFGRGTFQQQLARTYVMSLLHSRMLRRDVKVSHSPLQRRVLIKRTAAARSKTCIDDTNAGRSDPNRCLGALCLESIIIQRSGKCVVPMTPGLDLAKCPRCSEFSFDAAEFVLEYF